MNIFIDRVKNQVGLLAFHKSLKEITFDIETLERWCEPSFQTSCRKLLEQEKNLFRYVENEYGVKPEIYDRVFIIPDVCEFDMTDFQSPRLQITDPWLTNRRFWCGKHIFRMIYQNQFPPQFTRALEIILIEEGVAEDDSE